MGGGGFSIPFQKQEISKKFGNFVAYFGDSIRTKCQVVFFPSHSCPYLMWKMTSCAIETKQCSLQPLANIPSNFLTNMILNSLRILDLNINIRLKCYVRQTVKQSEYFDTNV